MAGRGPSCGREEDPHSRTRPWPAKEPPNGLLILYNISRIICILSLCILLPLVIMLTCICLKYVTLVIF